MTGYEETGEALKEITPKAPKYISIDKFRGDNQTIPDTELIYPDYHT